MNEIVTKFIEEQKKIKKEKHLLDIGLVDSSKVEKKYAPANYSLVQAVSEGYSKKDERGNFKYVWPNGKPIALDVTDEEYEEICKICPSKIEEKEKNEKFKEFQGLVLDELEALRKMVKFFVVLTVISIICGLILAIIAVSGGGY